MTDPIGPIGDGHTELSEEQRKGLLPSYIATLGDLNDAEQRNIAEALLRRPPAADHLLDDVYLRGLHAAMFKEVWEWAGRYRLVDTNIGIDWTLIAVAVRNLVDDARDWVEHTTFDADELGVRFHHRLVAIHAFPNGNGRHGRVAADYLIRALGREPYSWGANRALSPPSLRAAYVAALRRADEHDIDDLVVFARS